jgi:hypothetical protein
VHAIVQKKMGSAPAFKLGFVSGHDFSRAVKNAKKPGL